MWLGRSDHVALYSKTVYGIMTRRDLQFGQLTLHQKLHGNVEDLRRTTKFILVTSLDLVRVNKKKFFCFSTHINSITKEK